jgi:four helix bundle protein
MKNEVLRDRTKRFALRAISLFTALPKTDEARTIGKQLLRSGTSVAANYREASRARSDAELKSKLGIVEQELDDSLLWMELLVESAIVDESKLKDLMKETNELLAMTVAAIRTIKSRE